MSATRQAYRQLTDVEKALIATIKAHGDVLIDVLDGMSPEAGRERALARTKIEEAVMWAVKGITG